MPLQKDLTYIILASAVYAEVLKQAESKMEKDIATGLWICLVCGIVRKKSHLFDHIEARHVVHPGYTCDHCVKSYRSRATYRKHRRDFLLFEDIWALSNNSISFATESIYVLLFYFIDNFVLYKVF